MKRGLIFLIAAIFLVLGVEVERSWADKSGATIEAPASVDRDSEVTVRITFSHKGNSIFHHTDWARVVVNQKEVARWEFSGFKKPEAAVFIREVKIKATEDLEVSAEANCNLHGSKGPATVKITVK